MSAAKHMWLVSRLRATREDDQPEVVAPTKAAAKSWVKAADPELVFSESGERGYFVARTRERDCLVRYSIQKIPVYVPTTTGTNTTT